MMRLLAIAVVGFGLSLAPAPAEPPRELPAVPGLLQMTRDENELSLIVVDSRGQAQNLMESLGAQRVDEQSVGLEETLIAYVGRHGKESHLLKRLGNLA